MFKIQEKEKSSKLGKENSLGKGDRSMNCQGKDWSLFRIGW